MHEPNCGLIVVGSSSAFVHREQIIELAAQYQLPAVYQDRGFISTGGLISYGPDRLDDAICRCKRRPNTSW
jgi:putative ABC transport system substrate-binding protein